MNILIVNSFYYPHERGGAEKSVRILAENLVKRGHEVTVLTLSDEGNEACEKISNVSVIRLPIKNIYHPNESHSLKAFSGKVKKAIWHLIDTYNFYSAKMLKDRLRNSNFDIVHTNNISGFSVSVWDWANARHIPIVHTSRDYYLFNPNCTLFSKGRNEDPKSLKIKLLSFIKKRKSQKVNSYVGISNFISSLHIDNGFFKNAQIVKVVYNGIGSVSSLEQKKIRLAHIGIKEAGPIKFGYLGRIDSAKGIELVIDYLKSSTLNFVLKIGGGGNPRYIDYIKSKCHNDPRFIFLGHVSIDDYFPEIDCLICSSLWNEPMGRVVIESFSYGVPVIGSKAGGIGELINVGKSGFVFDMRSNESFINAINKYIHANKEDLSANCYLEAEKYSDSSYVENYISIYKNTLTL